MRCDKTIYGIAWALLLYLFLFVIPPLSSLASKDGMIDFDLDPSVNLERPWTQIYLVDLLIWEQLEESEHSAVSPVSFFVSRYDPGNNTSSAGIEPQSALSQLETPVLFYAVAFQSRVHPLSRSASIQFERSGISPPFLS